jgi:hypothetical protein
LSLESLEGILSDLNHVGYKGWGDSLLNHILPFDFLADEVNGGTSFFENFMIKLEALAILFNFSLQGDTSFVGTLEAWAFYGGRIEVLLLHILLALQVAEASFL